MLWRGVVSRSQGRRQDLIAQPKNRLAKSAFRRIAGSRGSFIIRTVFGNERQHTVEDKDAERTP
jgi:hypothetical protein